VPHDQADDLEVPDTAEERTRWLLAGAHRLADAVRRTGPGTGVWSWAEERTAGFWLRRITHDTLVHRLDAELAVGRPVTPLAPELAADSVSDLLDLFRILPRIDDFPALAELRGCSATGWSTAGSTPRRGGPTARPPAHDPAGLSGADVETGPRGSYPR
jgi:Mycothiol maleylpyruvate isomerase N-terminal domain